MKQVFLTIVILISLSLSCRSQNKFDYEVRRSGAYIVTPLFDHVPKENAIVALAIFRDEKWILQSLYSILNISMPDLKKKAQSIDQKVGNIEVTYYLTGKAYKIRFFLGEQLKEMITEEELYMLYNHLKSFKLDMSKLDVELPPKNSPDRTCVFIKIYPMIPKE
jgi:hypothetical protein